MADFEYPKTLEQAQDMMLVLMDNIEGIYSQLNDPTRRKIYKSEKEYLSWRNSAFSANAHLGNDLEALEAYILKCFKVEYPTKQSLLLAIHERNYKPPRWLRNEPLTTFKDSLEPEEMAESGNIPPLASIALNPQFQTVLKGILDRLIEARGRMSQDEVGGMLAVTGSTVSSWERGRSPITLQTVMKLCQIYDVKVGWVLVGNEINIEDVRTVFQMFSEAAELAKSLLE